MLSHRIRHSPWLVLVVSSYIQCFNSAGYVSTAYSQALKTSLQLDQWTLTSIGTFGGLGCCFGFIPGYLYHFLPPWVLLLIGSVLSASGYFMIWLTIRHKIQGAFLQLCLYSFLTSLSMTFFHTSALIPCLKIFPSRNGAASGLLKGYMVLGATVLLQLFYLLCGSDEMGNLPWMLSWLIPLPMFIGMLGLKSQHQVAKVRVQDKVEASNFHLLSGILVVLAAYLSGVTVLEAEFEFNRSSYLIICLGIMVFLILPLTTVLRAALQDDGETNEQQSLLMKQEEEATDMPTVEKPAEDGFTLVQVLSSLDFWLLLVALVCGFGVTTAVHGNLAQLGVSLGQSQRMINVCVSLLCICACLGKVGAGLLLDHCSRAYGTPGSLFLMLAQMTASASILLVAVSVRGSFVISTILSGLSEGVILCLSVAVASELFGMRSLSVVFNLLFITGPVGSYLFSVLVVGYFYDVEAEKAKKGSLLCYGSQCFRTSFCLLAAVSLVGAGISGILVLRNKRHKM